MPSVCEQVQLEYQDIKALKREFDLEYEKARETGNLARVKELRAVLQKKREALAEKLWIFEALPAKELQVQYERQREILEKNGILQKLGNGEKMGIRAIDGREYVFPALKDIRQGMMRNKEILRTKTEQGFNQLLIVPFGMKLDDLIATYRKIILNHHKKGKLLATKEHPSDPDEPLTLDETTPVWVWGEYPGADVSGELVYGPEKLPTIQDEPDAAKRRALSRGKTKRHILEDQGGFTILLLENLPNIPRSGRGKPVSGRKQPEAGQTPKKYLEMMQTDPHYTGEEGMTPEEQLIYAIEYLEATNQVMDDWHGNGSVSYQIGAYFHASGHVPYAFWNRDHRQAHLDSYDPEYSDPNFGVRGAVRVKILKT